MEYSIILLTEMYVLAINTLANNSNQWAQKSITVTEERTESKIRWCPFPPFCTQRKFPYGTCKNQSKERYNERTTIMEELGMTKTEESWEVMK